MIQPINLTFYEFTKESDKVYNCQVPGNYIKNFDDYEIIYNDIPDYTLHPEFNFTRDSNSSIDKNFFKSIDPYIDQYTTDDKFVVIIFAHDGKSGNGYKTFYRLKILHKIQGGN